MLVILMDRGAGLRAEYDAYILLEVPCLIVMFFRQYYSFSFERGIGYNTPVFCAGIVLLLSPIAQYPCAIGFVWCRVPL